jgi:protein-S-isoprenylcysteine O-methyltransferase Ste14
MNRNRHASDSNPRGLQLKVPPLATVSFMAAFMWLISVSLPKFHFFLPVRDLLATSICIAGAIISGLGVYSFRRSRTTVNPMKPSSTTSLVVTGVYTISRNPMYLGFLLLLIGWATFLSNLIAFLVLPLFVVYMNRFQIEPEERVLASLFGQQFVEYKSRVRRWL